MAHELEARVEWLRGVASRALGAEERVMCRREYAGLQDERVAGRCEYDHWTTSSARWCTAQVREWRAGLLRRDVVFSVSLAALIVVVLHSPGVLFLSVSLAAIVVLVSHSPGVLFLSLSLAAILVVLWHSLVVVFPSASLAAVAVVANAVVAANACAPTTCGYSVAQQRSTMYLVQFSATRRGPRHAVCETMRRSGR